MTGAVMTPDDEERLIAGVDLIGRSGATNYEVGYLYDPDTMPDEYAEHGPAWWAHARYRGARLLVENQPDPVTATEKLVRRVLAGAQCNWCKLAVVVPESPDQPHRFGTCRYVRYGDTWVRGCTDTHPASPFGQKPGLSVSKANRAQRRQSHKRNRGKGHRG